MRLDFNDPNFFGKDIAEDEAEEIFNSYYFDRPEAERFANNSEPFMVVRAYKGEGKSALIRIAQNKIIKSSTPPPLIVHGQGNNLAPSIDTEDFASWVRIWKKSILDLIAAEVGNRIGFAWNDDSMTLVEHAEKNQFKRKNIIGAIMARIAAAIKVGGTTVDIEVKKGAPKAADLENSIRRETDIDEPFWFFLDDVDQNFENKKQLKIKVASFFIACREIIQKVPQLRIRAAIRPNTWKIIKLEFDSLSHVEPYVFDLKWSEESIRKLLARRIEGYAYRNDLFSGIGIRKTDHEDDNERNLISLIFDDPMPWGKKTRPPHVVLYTLCKHRPRWLIEICKFAAGTGKGKEKIGLTDIVTNLRIFGQRRIEDLTAEFRCQCPEIGELMGAFAREKEEFKTDELMDLIQKKISNHVTPTITGTKGTPSSSEIARFLLEIGFLYGRRDQEDGSYEHYSFVEIPDAFVSRTSQDYGLKWEIHPVFRQFLEIRDSSGTLNEAKGKGNWRG